MNGRSEMPAPMITVFADQSYGLRMRCHRCHDEQTLGFGDWRVGELTAKASKHYCEGGWL